MPSEPSILEMPLEPAAVNADPALLETQLEPITVDNPDLGESDNSNESVEDDDTMDPAVLGMPDEPGRPNSE